MNQRTSDLKTEKAIAGFLRRKAAEGCQRSASAAPNERSAWGWAAAGYGRPVATSAR